LIYAAERTPPKFFLTKTTFTPPAAAEVSIIEKADGADVVLRLMWGPLPAPFPRALFGIGLVLGMSVLTLSDRTVGTWILAMLFIFLPFAALLRQQEGEKELQERLGNLLDGATFTAKPHSL
jgi:hypothetical protein